MIIMFFTYQCHLYRGSIFRLDNITSSQKEELCADLYNMFNGHPPTRITEVTDVNQVSPPLLDQHNAWNFNTSEMKFPTNRSLLDGFSVYGHPHDDNTGTPALIRFYILTVIIPAFCCIGILGNIFNILVVSKQRAQVSMDRSAYTILIALALSDMACCISLLPGGFNKTKHYFFNNISFWLVYEMYGIYFQNLFSHISTWLMIIIAVSRHIAICYPFTSKEVITIGRTIVAIIIVSVAWMVLDLPYIWSYELNTISCTHEDMNNGKYFTLELGYLNSNPTFRHIFTYTGTILGFLVPVITLTYCSYHLIKAVKSSLIIQQHITSVKQTQRSTPKTHVTYTLITIVVVFQVLILPSECLQIWFFFHKNKKTDLILMVAVICNAFHTLNFSINFILYTVVNSQFRKTFVNNILCRPSLFQTRAGKHLHVPVSNHQDHTNSITLL